MVQEKSVHHETPNHLSILPDLQILSLKLSFSLTESASERTRRLIPLTHQPLSDAFLTEMIPTLSTPQRLP